MPRRWRLSVMTMIILAVLTAFIGCKPKTETDPTPEPLSEADQTPESLSEASFEDLARGFMRNITLGDYNAARNMMNTELKDAITADELRSYWEQLIIGTLGAYSGITSIETDPLVYEGRYTFLTVYSAHLANGFLGMTQLTFDEEYNIAGLYFNIETETVKTPQITPDPETYVRWDGFTEETLVLGADTDYPLTAVLSIPKEGEGPFPVVVLVHGSGPMDRDETVGEMTPFKDISNYLASHGIAVLRYDKRTLIHGQKLLDEFGNELTVYQETIEDALLAKELLLGDARIDGERVFVLGHSQGGTFAPEIAETGDFAGMIIMAGSLRPQPELMVEQLDYIYSLSAIAPETRAAMLSSYLVGLEAFREAMEMTDEEAMEVDVYGMSAYYFTNMTKRDPASFVEAINRPALIIQGNKDYQCLWDVDFAEYQSLTADNPLVTCNLYEGLHHFFMKSYADGRYGAPEDYEIAGRVDANVLADITAFILDN